jgi:hypothetical protein
VNKNNAIVEVNQPGAVFTGLAIGTGPQGQTLLYAADNKNGVIDVYNQNFQLVTTLPLLLLRQPSNGLPVHAFVVNHACSP